MLIELLQRAAAAQPTKVALAFGDQRLTYPEIERHAARLASGLAAAGIRPGDNVAVLLRNCPEFVVTFFALTGLGAATLLLDPLAREHELAHAARDRRPRTIITDAEGLGRWQASTEGISETEFSLTVGAGSDGDDAFWRLVAEHDEWSRWETDEQLVASYQYSSGSTGRAKRIGRTHGQYAFEASAFAAAAGHGPEDVLLCVLPLFHSYPLGTCMLTATCVGATLVVQERVQPFVLHRLETLELAREWGVTVLSAVPYVFEALAGIPGSETFPSLRYCASSGAPLSEAIFRAFDERFGIPVRQDYGSTESGKVSVNVDPDPRASWASVGKALPGIELVILDEEGQRVPAKTVGNIAIRSPGLTTDHPYEGLRDSPFVGDYYLTGDVGFLDEEERLTIVGRTKVFLDVLGEKVDPEEVEEVLAGHPSVCESVVVGVTGRGGATEVKAVVVPDGPCEGRELVRYCKERLASYKVPSIVEFRDSLPRSQIGKLLRKDLIG